MKQCSGIIGLHLSRSRWLGCLTVVFLLFLMPLSIVVNAEDLKDVDGVVSALFVYRQQLNQMQVEYERVVRSGPLPTCDSAYCDAFIDAFIEAEKREAAQEIPEQFRESIGCAIDPEQVRSWITPRVIGGCENVYRVSLGCAEKSFAGEIRDKQDRTIRRDFVSPGVAIGQRRAGPNLPPQGRVDCRSANTDGLRSDFAPYSWEKALSCGGDHSLTKIETIDNGFCLKQYKSPKANAPAMELHIQPMGDGQFVPVLQIMHRVHKHETVIEYSDYKEIQMGSESLWLPGRVIRRYKKPEENTVAALPAVHELNSMPKGQLLSYIETWDEHRLVDASVLPGLESTDLVFCFEPDTQIEFNVNNKTVSRFTAEP